MDQKTQSLRPGILRSTRRVVVKVGSGVLTVREGLNMTVVKDLVSDICELRSGGKEIILVSSGAIASGLKKIGFSKRPKSVSQLQAIAAVGQSSLMSSYEDAFRPYGQKVAQVLITRDDLIHRRRYLNARNTIMTLLSWKILPIINENDTVAVDEIKFGDNDNLSAMVTNLSDAHLLVNLTNMDGLFDRDPREDPEAKFIPLVAKVDRKVAKFAGTIPGFLGTGGMASKVKAAHKVALAGVPTIIANGLKPHILNRIFSGEEEGTLFLPRETSLCSRKHWIAFTKSPRGELLIDRGAEKALLENGKSLLPSGIIDVKGRFSPGDAVLLINPDGREVAVGMVNYHSGDVAKIIGVKTSEIESRLGFKQEDEVVHRDNLVITADTEDGDDICRLRS